MEKDEPVLRVVSGDDWVAIREIRLRALADSPDAFGATLEETQSHPESLWRERADQPWPTLVVFERERPVAMGGVFLPDGSGLAMVWGMWTAPEARGRGYGRRILTELVSWCRHRELDVILHVTEGNGVARQLYATHGFVATGEWEPLRPGSPLRMETMRLTSGAS